MFGGKVVRSDEWNSLVFLFAGFIDDGTVGGAAENAALESLGREEVDGVEYVRFIQGGVNRNAEAAEGLFLALESPGADLLPELASLRFAAIPAPQQVLCEVAAGLKFAGQGGVGGSGVRLGARK